MIITKWTDTEEEKTQIINLSRQTFGDVEITNPLYFDWQYRKNPEGKALVLLAKDDSKNNLIVGSNTIIPIKLLVDNEEIISSLACNVQVHPNYQKKGVFSNLLSSMSSEATEKGISSLFAVPNENSFNSFIKEGSIEITQLPLLVRPIKFSQYFQNPLNKILSIFDYLWKTKISDETVQEFDGNFDNFQSLLLLLSERVPVLLKRNTEFFKWRYLEHPTKKYKIFVLKEKNIIIGYIIIRIHILNKKKIGVILDYVVDPNAEHSSLKKLIIKAMNYFWKHDASLAIATVGIGLEKNLLQESNFFHIPSFLKPEPLHFIIRLFNSKNNLQKLKSFDNWFFTFGDYDIF